MGRRKGKRLPARAIIAAVVLIVLGVGVYLAGRLMEGEAPEERSQMTEGFGRYEEMIHEGKTWYKKTGVTTILLMGIDRDTTAPQEGYRGGGQADLMLLLVIDRDAKTVRQLQIERDTMARVHVLTITGRDGGYRDMQICLSHAYGTTQPECAENALEAVNHYLDNQKVDLYMQVDYSAVGLINDLLGGVTVTVEEDLTAIDPAMTPGTTLTLHGEQAERFVRARMTVGDGTNASRQLRQRVWLSGASELLEEKVKADSGFINTLLETLGNRLLTNATQGRLINEFNAAIGLERLPVEQIPGEYGIGSDGYVEYYTAAEDVTEWVLDALYRPAEE